MQSFITFVNTFEKSSAVLVMGGFRKFQALQQTKKFMCGIFVIMVLVDYDSAC